LKIAIFCAIRNSGCVEGGELLVQQGACLLISYTIPPVITRFML